MMLSPGGSERDLACEDPLRIDNHEVVRSCQGDLLPGEEKMHARLQSELIEKLACSHRAFGLIVEIEARVGGSGSELHGMLRSIQAGPGRFSCEFLELCPGTEVPKENRFFTIVPPEEERSRASVLVLAKAAALMDCEEMHPVSDGYFDAVSARDR